MSRAQNPPDPPSCHAIRRGFFGVGIWHNKAGVNFGTLVRSAAIFGADYVFTIGRRWRRQNSSVKMHRHVPVFHYNDGDDFLEHAPMGARVVCVELADESEDLADFRHPHQAVYLLGAEDHGLPERITRAATTIKMPGTVSLNVATAGSIVMYDRITKRGVR